MRLLVRELAFAPLISPTSTRRQIVDLTRHTNVCFAPKALL